MDYTKDLLFTIGERERIKRLEALASQLKAEKEDKPVEESQANIQDVNAILLEVLKKALLAGFLDDLDQRLIADLRLHLRSGQYKLVDTCNHVPIDPLKPEGIKGFKLREKYDAGGGTGTGPAKGTEAFVNDYQLEQLKELVQGGKKIAAVKELRGITGFSLRSAKEYIEELTELFHWTYV